MQLFNFFTKLAKSSSLVLLFTSMSTSVFAQVNITGTVVDGDNNESIPGAIIIFGDGQGAVSDYNGKFVISGDFELPLNLQISFLGFQSVEITVDEASKDLGMIKLTPSPLRLDEIVISASRVEESILQAPVSIETMGIRTIESTPSANFYDGLANLKGVQPNTGSILFSSINTRGFADPNNLRFVQLLDGASIVTPAFGIIGNTAGVSELDVEGMELLPGASSALYGANAFNGLLLIKTKDPFENRGLSLALKQGNTVQQRGTDPYTQLSLRLADFIVDQKLAFKVDYETIQATDWQMVDSRPKVGNIANQAEEEDFLANNPVNNPAWDQVDRFGEADSEFDSVFLTKTDGTPDTIPTIRRTGVTEQSIFRPKIEHHKVNAGLYYRPIKGNNLEFSYLYKYSISDLVFRITTSYPFYDFEQFHHQFRIKNDWLTFRTFYNGNTANNSFAGRFAGKTIEQTLLPNDEWLDLYKDAYAGRVNGVSGDSHYDARLYADSFMAQPGSSEFERVRNLAENTYAPAGTQGRFSPQSGARLFENSSYYHADLNLDLSQFLNNVVSLQAGASYRQYSLDSEGSFFNDGPLGFDGAIEYYRYSMYAQASKTFLNERLKLVASGLYNKREELDGFLTPKGSIVYSLGEKKNHSLRLSYQTGFRNPSPQEGYINYWVAPEAFVLGGLKENIENFKFEAADGSTVTAKDFFDNVQGVSYEDALEGLKAERNTVYEIGYRGAFKKLFLDASYVYTSFENFMQNRIIASATSPAPKDLLGVAIWYNNIDQTVSTHTANFEVNYVFPSGFKIESNYSYNRLDASNYTEADPANREITLRYNTPRHRLNTTFSNSNLYKGFGFNITHRVNSAYDYQSSFGENRIASFNIVDAAITKRLPKLKALLKVGGTNIFNEPYTFVYGGPNIGSMHYISMRFDDLGGIFK